MTASHQPAAPPSSGELHIAGVLVHARPLQLAVVQRRIDALAHADVFRSHADGRLVVVVEGESTGRVLDTVDAIRALPGVLDVALVYQHAEPWSAMQQEIEG